MIEPRIYRAAFIPAVLAAVLVMFSLQSRPRPLPQGLAADVLFEGSSAQETASEIVERAPDRSAGSVGDRDTARYVRSQFRQRGFSVETDRFSHDGKQLANIIGRRAGKSRDQVVVVAARDARGVPDAGGSAADTAALIELARVFEGRPSNKTLVLASVDGSALGEVGAERLAGELEDPGSVDGVLVVSGLGHSTSDRPAVVGWSNDTTRVGIGLQRTVVESLRQEIGQPAEGASPGGQLARMAFPIGIGAQGPLLESGYDAVRIAGAGELGPTPDAAEEPLDRERFEGLGRASLRALTAIEQGPAPERGPTTYVTAVSQVMPGWVLAVFGAALIFPALVASVDAFARARRRREPVGAWLLWIAAGAVALALGLGLAYALALTGALPEPPPAAPAPSLFELDGAGAVSLAAVIVIGILSWFALRFLARRADPELADPGAHGAGVAIALTLTAGVIALWLADPFAALLLIPALHLWILATLTDPAPPPRARAVMVAFGLLLPLLVAVYHLFALDLDPLRGAWYLLLLVTGGHVTVLSALVWCLLAAVFVSVVLAVRSEPPDTPGQPAPSVRGPASYAGPGALGGVDSALKR